MAKKQVSERAIRVHSEAAWERAERYEEMVEFMRRWWRGGRRRRSDVEERNLLSVAYKNVIESIRAAWRIVSSIEQKEEGRKNEEHMSLVKEYRSKVEKELSQVCASILNLLDSHLVPSVAASESKVFYLKMKGDYHRYLVEFKVGDQRKTAAEDTMLSYKAAQGENGLSGLGVSSCSSMGGMRWAKGLSGPGRKNVTRMGHSKMYTSGLRHGTIDDLAHLASAPTISPSSIAPAGNQTRDLALILLVGSSAYH
ncbi:hypothetical protein Fmac_030088 [Flemingia macrophylla]|uniref:14-3-3 domain-containing protein n=1 Tax=Flemingia macrophylla TaxID=520843 RepID=A0ABD1LC61_9FABA